MEGKTPWAPKHFFDLSGWLSLKFSTNTLIWINFSIWSLEQVYLDYNNNKSLQCWRIACPSSMQKWSVKNRFFCLLPSPTSIHNLCNFLWNLAKLSCCWSPRNSNRNLYWSKGSNWNFSYQTKLNKAFPIQIQSNRCIIF